jgi:hypothetical protein
MRENIYIYIRWFITNLQETPWVDAKSCITWSSILTVLFTLLKQSKWHCMSAMPKVFLAFSDKHLALYDIVPKPCKQILHFTQLKVYKIYIFPTYLPTQYKNIWVCNGKPMILYNTFHYNVTREHKIFSQKQTMDNPKINVQFGRVYIIHIHYLTYWRSTSRLFIYINSRYRMFTITHTAHKCTYR